MPLQYVKLRDLREGFSRCREASRWARIFESETRELKRTLQAERKHVQELQRSLSLHCGAGECALISWLPVIRIWKRVNIKAICHYAHG